MKMQPRQSSQDILNSTRRLPWDRRAQATLLARLPGSRQGIPASTPASIPFPVLHPVRECDLEEAIRDGFLVLRSAALRADFLLVNVEVGRSLLGEAKATVFCFHSAPGQDAWMPLMAPDRLDAVLSAIGNMGCYRHPPPGNPSLPADSLDGWLNA